MDLRAACALKTSTVWDARMVAVIAMDGVMPDTVYELTGLYLDPDYIGKGFGKLTMDWVKREIFARGYKSVSLWVLNQNDRAKAFYEKSGFKADGSSKESSLGNTKEERYICELTE